MKYGGRKTSCSPILMAVAAAVVALWVGGWTDFLSEKPAGVEARRIVDELSGVRPVPDPNIPLPEVYSEPPRIIEQMVGGQPECKLIYFCKHHVASELQKVIHDQFASILFNEKGKGTRVVDYGVSSVPATNQLIVRCPAREDAEAVLQVLEGVDVPVTQVKIDCIISEVYADQTLDWETSLLIENLFGEHIWAGPAARPFGESIVELVDELANVTGKDVLPSFPGASLRELARAKMGLKVGYAGEHFLALVDILESQGYLKILMNPTLEVVNGKTAKVSQTQEVPRQQIMQERPDWQYITTRTEYVNVVDSLEITPHVFAEGYIGLETKIHLGSKLTPEGVKQLPIITEKEIENKENRIRQGESLVIGGIRKTEKRDVSRGVPFLKDIPLLGILFSGRDFEERAVETIFILTPTISTGGRPTEEVIEEVNRKHEGSETGTSHDALTDPLGLKARQREQQRKADEAEQIRLKAQAEKAEARHAVREAEAQAERAENQAQLATSEATRLKAEAEQSRADAAKLTTESNLAKEKAAAAEKQLQAEVEKAKAEAQTAQAEVERLKAELKKAEEKAAAEAERKKDPAKPEQQAETPSVEAGKAEKPA